VAAKLMSIRRLLDISIDVYWTSIGRLRLGRFFQTSYGLWDAYSLSGVLSKNRRVKLLALTKLLTMTNLWLS